MKQTIEATGKNVAQALEKALEELKLSEEDVEVSVISEGEPGGLLGIGRKLAKISVTYDDEIAPKAAATIASEAVATGADAEKNGDSAADADNLAVKAEKTDRKYAKSEELASAEEIDAVEDSALDYIQDILSGIGIHGDIESFIDEDNYLHIEVSGSSCGAVIGRRGETLDAIQYLTNIVANLGREHYVRIIMDIGGYRQRHEEKAVDFAVRMAEKVQKSGRPFFMKPMRPAARRAVHVALRDMPGISTYSEGFEPSRYVVIVPENEAPEFDNSSENQE